MDYFRVLVEPVSGFRRDLNESDLSLLTVLNGII
jgi:hypothetical protein